MPSTTNKAIFDSIYNPFGVDLNGRPLFSWDYYIENYGGRQYYVTCDITPKVPTDRIPFYTSITKWRADYPAAGVATGLLSSAVNILTGKTNIAGYLPANMGAYYFKMRPVEVGGNIDTWMQQATATGVKKIGNKIAAAWDLLTGQYQNIIRDTPAGAYVTVFTSAGYRNVLVPLNSNYFDFKFSIFDSEIMEDVKDNIDETNVLLRKYALSVEKQYNRVLKIENSGRYTSLDLGTKSSLALVSNAMTQRVANLQNSEAYLTKVCKDCQKNARIGAIPFVYIIVAIVLGFGAWELDKWLTHKKYLQQQQQQIDRETAALDKIEQAVMDPSLTAEQRNAIIDAANGVISSSRSIQQETATSNNTGFFDKVENLLFLAGGFLILNNVTKKNK